MLQSLVVGDRLRDELSTRIIDEVVAQIEFLDDAARLDSIGYCFCGFVSELILSCLYMLQVVAFA